MIPGTTDRPVLQTIPAGADDLVLARRSALLINEALAAQSPLMADWKKWREYYEGDQWQNLKRRASWRVSNVINVTFANIETCAALVMAMMPELMASPANGQTKVEMAERVTAALKFLWKKLKMRKTTVLVLKDGLMYGSGIFKVTWNRDAGRFVEDLVYTESGEKKTDKRGRHVKAKKREGEVAVGRVSPFRFFPDPLALSIEDAAYVVQVSDVDLGHIRRRWPDKVGKVAADATGTPILDSVWSADPVISAPDRDPATVPGKKNAGSTPVRNRVTLYELWVRDVSLLHDADADIDWAAEYEKAPNGRVITMTGSTILQNVPNPFEDGRFPFVKFDNVPRPDRFWGKSEIDIILSLQDELNRRSSQLMESANLTANPKVAIPLGSGLDGNTVITTKPGEKWPYRGPKAPEFVPPPAMPSYVPQLLDRSLGHLERVSGNYDMLSGARPSGVSANAALQTLKEMAEMRPREKMENLCAGLSEVGEMMLSRMQQHYDRKREIAITSEDGSGSVEFAEIDDEVLGGLYSINIDVGSTLPTSQAIMFQWATTLREMGAIDNEAMLELINLPGRDRILKRMRQQEEEERQFQLQLAQMGGQPQSKSGPMPPGPFSLREPAPQGGPPPPPPGMPPELASSTSQLLEMAAGRGMAPEQLVQMLQESADTGMAPPELAPLFGAGGA